MEPSVDSLCRVTIRRPMITGPVSDTLTVSGYLVEYEPTEPPQAREILRPIQPDEPDPEKEIAYSRNALEPLTVVYQGRKRNVSLTPYLVFRYVYDSYRAAGKAEFDFYEISIDITGNGMGLSSHSIRHCVKTLRMHFVKLRALIDFRIAKEILYIEETRV